MADVPEDLLTQIKYLEKVFTVDQSTLKKITDHFVKELGQGSGFLTFAANVATALTFV